MGHCVIMLCAEVKFWMRSVVFAEAMKRDFWPVVGANSTALTYAERALST